MTPCLSCLTISFLLKSCLVCVLKSYLWCAVLKRFVVHTTFCHSTTELHQRAPRFTPLFHFTSTFPAALILVTYPAKSKMILPSPIASGNNKVLKLPTKTNLVIQNSTYASKVLLGSTFQPPFLLHSTFTPFLHL